jgi:hypothetical protein
MAPVELDVPVGAHDEQPSPLEMAGQMLEQQQGGAVGPVQVVEHEHQGGRPRGINQEGGHAYAGSVAFSGQVREQADC